MCTTGSPRVSCFVWWYKHLRISKVIRIQFVPTPHTYETLNSSIRRVMGAEQVSDTLQNLGFFVGASVGGIEPQDGVEYTLSSALAASEVFFKIK